MATARKVRPPGLYPNERECRDCGITKPHEAFSLSPRSRGGLQIRCKTCITLRYASRKFVDRQALAERGLVKCNVCGVVKSVDAFHKGKSRSAGTKAECKECRSRERALVYAAEPAAAKQARRDYYLANRTQETARVAAWHRAHPEAPRIAATTYRRAHPERVLLWKQRRNAHKRNALIVPFSAAQLAAKLEFWGNRCWMCGGPSCEVDHVKPLSRGGPHCLANLRPSCRPCNIRKRAQWPYPLVHYSSRKGI